MTDSTQPDDPTTAVETAPDSPAERKPRRRRAVKSEVEGGANAGAPESERASAVVAVVDAGPVPRVAEPPAGPSAARSDDVVPEDAGPTAGKAPDGADETGRRKRSRNRRRNRRSREAGRDGARPDGTPNPDATDEMAPGSDIGLPVTDVNELFADVVSGAYDGAEATTSASPGADALVPDEQAEDAAPAAPAAPADAVAGLVEAGPAAPQRRVLSPEPEAPKLQKVLAQAGVGSRRDLEQMIVEGRVVVNGQPAHVGQRVKAGDRITLDGKPVRVRITPPPARVLAYHKPVGEVVTHDDPQARPTVFRVLPRLAHGKWQSVGRLDINTEGLLLFTNSGDLANRLTHPRFGVEREYAVRVLGTLTDEEREQLLQGVDIDGQPAAFRSIADGGGEGVNHWYRVVITEGRNREVRRMFDAVNKAVSRLIRIRYGSIVLPRGLKRGVWVDLSLDDVKALREVTGMPARAGKGGRDSRDGRDAGEEERRSGRRGRRGRSRDRQESQPGVAPAGQPGFVADFDGEDDRDLAGPIPNPLLQTYDKRAFQQSRRTEREYAEDGPIPNPLQQTYDKRAVEADRRPKREYSDDGPIPNPLQQTYDKRFAQGPKTGAKAGAGGARRKPGAGRAKGASGGQPDPMRTAVGYIGGDAFLKKQRGTGTGGSGGRAGGRGRRGKGR